MRYPRERPGILSPAARAWRKRLHEAMRAPYTPDHQREISVRWSALAHGERWQLANVLSDRERLWLSAAGRGGDPDAGPRAVLAWATPAGLRLVLDDRREVLVPWHISLGLLGASDDQRALIEVRVDGRLITWPELSEEQQVADLVEAAAVIIDRSRVS